ncbi:MAG TPA: DegT/DnrJ/EryC1/StrS family aminotransferase [Acidobacteriaceae bacterium]|nr:DegT/DnrJ/EryC1/StrS family aminotransferase [Acidobacteriaceae bacterium]
MKVPMTRPAPPRLSLSVNELQLLEESGIFSNFGPVNTRFEKKMLDGFFGGKGACMTVCNATIGLMLAVKEAVGEPARGQYALMPSFTFAAAAHAAIWCGLTPLLCDIHPQSWSADHSAEAKMLRDYAGKIAVVMPYATFGYAIDLQRYTRIAQQLGLPVVVDAAASLGTFDEHGLGFGSDFAGSVVYSMHATKSFAAGEAGLIYSADPDRIARLRTMSSFGFGEPRSATMPGLNAKLSEVGALLCELRLPDYERICRDRATLLEHYRKLLPQLEFQQRTTGLQAHQFTPALLPGQYKRKRTAIRAQLEDRGIGTGAYFSPHLMEQPYFRDRCVAGPLPVCDEVAARMISLPLFDGMTRDEVEYVAQNVHEVLGGRTPLYGRRKSRSSGEVAAD